MIFFYNKLYILGLFSYNFENISFSMSQPRARHPPPRPPPRHSYLPTTEIG